MMSHSILMIDDDWELGKRLIEYFKRFDLSLTVATDPLSGLQQLQSESYQLVILDLMLPEVDGFEVCMRIRERHQTPILILSARNELIDRVVGLELGADDYLPKPFEPRELIARVQSLIRRFEQYQPPAHAINKASEVFGPLRIDRAAQQAYLSGRNLALTATEFRILSMLVANYGQPVTRNRLYELIRGDARLDSRAVDVMVSKLRHKLVPLQCIHTLRNVGYQFFVPPEMLATSDDRTPTE